MTVVLDTLEQLAALAETMLGAAGLGEWEKLASLEARRQTLANSLPASLANDLSGATSTRAQALIERYLRHHHDRAGTGVDSPKSIGDACDLGAAAGLRPWLRPPSCG